jgi:hypothetical protein
MWALTSILSVVYTFWAWMPDNIMHLFGIFYIPNRYWLLAIANHFFATWWVITIILHVKSILKCHANDSYHTMEDLHSRFGKPEGNKRHISQQAKDDSSQNSSTLDKKDHNHLTVA